MSAPFLTIVTRHGRRPWMLERCRASVLAQTCDDYEHVIIHDHVGVGIQGSHKAVAERADTFQGRYIWLLDDDDWLIEPGFVETVRRVAELENEPEAIIVRTQHVMGLCPDDRHWEARPEKGYIAMPCLVVRADVWRAHRPQLCAVESAGDFALAEAMHNAGREFVWLDMIATQVGQIGHGRMEKRYAQCADTLKRIPGLWQPGRLLYVGASALNVPAFAHELRQAGHEITLLEIWPQNVRYYEIQGSSFRYVLSGDVRSFDFAHLPHARYDVAVWWHGPEHVARDEVEPALARLEAVADLVVVACPFGERAQEPGLANPYQDHQCALYPADFRALGYQAQTIGERDNHGQLMAWKGGTMAGESKKAPDRGAKAGDALKRNERGEPQYVKVLDSLTYWCLTERGRFAVRDIPHMYALGLGLVETIAQDELDAIAVVEEPGE